MHYLVVTNVCSQSGLAFPPRCFCQHPPFWIPQHVPFITLPSRTLPAYLHFMVKDIQQWSQPRAALVLQ